jgi:hypothetical protein
LEAALLQAEAHEAEAARQADAGRLAELRRAFDQQAADDQAYVDAILARQPSVAELNQLRDRADALRRAAEPLRAAGVADVQVRRACDGYSQLFDHLERLQIAMRKFAKSPRPITSADLTRRAS